MIKINNVNFGGNSPSPLFRPDSRVLRKTDDVEMNSASQNTIQKSQMVGRELESVETVPFGSRRNSPNHFDDGKIMSRENTQLHSLLTYPFNDDDDGIDNELAEFNIIDKLGQHFNQLKVINKKEGEILEQRESDRASGTSSKMKNPIRRIWKSPGVYVYEEVASSPFEGVPENEPAPSRLDHLQQPLNKKHKK
ncbi:MAG: hypothetical protein ACON35_00380 [Candidatus Marinamargulisbacteria bacterium]